MKNKKRIEKLVDELSMQLACGNYDIVYDYVYDYVYDKLDGLVEEMEQSKARIESLEAWLRMAGTYACDCCVGCAYLGLDDGGTEHCLDNDGKHWVFAHGDNVPVYGSIIPNKEVKIMMKMDEIAKRLSMPFEASEIEWALFVPKEQDRGRAVAYLDMATIRKRLDEAVGPFSWRNEYLAYQDKCLGCGIGIYDAPGSGWVTKFDDAESAANEHPGNSAGGSFARAARIWGIGSYLSEMGSFEVEFEPKGNAFAIKEDQYALLSREHDKFVAEKFGRAAAGETSTGTSKGSSDTPENPGSSNQVPQDLGPDGECSARLQEGMEARRSSSGLSCEYRVNTVKLSGKSSQCLELADMQGNVVIAYARKDGEDIKAGVLLTDVRIEQKHSKHGIYNSLASYKLAA